MMHQRLLSLLLLLACRLITRPSPGLGDLGEVEDLSEFGMLNGSGRMAGRTIVQREVCGGGEMAFVHSSFVTSALMYRQ